MDRIHHHIFVNCTHYNSQWQLHFNSACHIKIFFPKKSYAYASFLPIYYELHLKWHLFQIISFKTYLSECHTKYLALYANYPVQLEQYPITF
jgi:hypothetical protein